MRSTRNSLHSHPQLLEQHCILVVEAAAGRGGATGRGSVGSVGSVGRFGSNGRGVPMLALAIQQQLQTGLTSVSSLVSGRDVGQHAADHGARQPRRLHQKLCVVPRQPHRNPGRDSADAVAAADGEQRVNTGHAKVPLIEADTAREAQRRVELGRHSELADGPVAKVKVPAVMSQLRRDPRSTSPNEYIHFAAFADVLAARASVRREARGRESGEQPAQRASLA